MTENKLLGKHKPSQEWYTPENIWDKVYSTFGIPKDDPEYLMTDPCPRYHLVSDGLNLDWTEHKFIYCNPPTPAAPWAKKALDTVKESKDTIIIFAAFSEAVLWQVNELLDHPICWVRNRINWIDGNEWVKVKQPPDPSYQYIRNGNTWLVENPNYLQPSKAPRNYNAFILLSDPSSDGSLGYYEIERRFCKEFSDLGTVQLSRQVYEPCKK